MALDNHAMARELARHEAKVHQVRKRAQHWRLTDCSIETLDNMRHSLIETMLGLEKSLAIADDQLTQFVESSEPLATGQAIDQINRISAEWNDLNTHLQEIDDAWLERNLQARLLKLLRSERNLYLLELCILICIVVAVVITLFELLIPDLPADLLNTFIAIDTVLAIILLIDFFMRMMLSDDRLWYLKKYWIDFVASIPFAGAVRFGRIFRLVRFIRILRLARLGRALRTLSFTFRGLDTLRETLQFTLLKRALVVAFALLLLGAVTIRSVERGVLGVDNPGAVADLDESLWWSFTTVVTGGFADLYNPQSTYGRLLTVGLVLLGFVITSIFTASLTSILVGDESERLEQNQHNLERQLDGLQNQLDLTSRESNSGLIALETVAQQLSNAETSAALFDIVTQSMTRDFEAIQASVHLLEDGAIQLHAHSGIDQACPAPTLKVGEQFLGRVAADLAQSDLESVDIEPISMPVPHLRGIRMALPMMAHKRLIGFIHVVLPENLGRYYLYNRAPMTLTHHAAVATYALHIAS